MGSQLQSCSTSRVSETGTIVEETNATTQDPAFSELWEGFFGFNVSGSFIQHNLY